MNLSTKLSILFVAALFLISYSCRRENNNAIISTPKAATIHSFYELYGPKKQSFKVNADNPQEIKLAGGSTIQFQKNAFTMKGNPVTGEVTVEILEVLKRSDMFLSGTNTNYKDGSILDSRGFLYIDVKSNGVEVDEDLKVPMYITLPWQQTSNELAILFKGNENNNEKGQFAWEIPDHSDTSFAEYINNTYHFPWQKLKWMNCDLFYDMKGPKTAVRIKIENSQWEMSKEKGTSNGFACFCPKGYNSMLQLWLSTGPNIVFTEEQIPVGITGKLVVMMVKDSINYFTQKEIVVQPNQASQTISLTGTPISAEDLKKEVEKLNSY